MLADPVWLCETEAMGYPMLHKDTERFPAEEALISEYWDRFLLPLKVFPMNGFIAWGCYPDRSYSSGNKVVMSQFHALSSLREYGVRREPWRHYARSGERIYYDYGYRFSRFTGDWYLAHTDAPGSPGKEKGGFITALGGRGISGKLPLFWGDRTSQFYINAGDIGHWLLEYYLTGDERSLELVHMIREAFRKNGWKPKAPTWQYHATGIRTLLTLFIMDWDEDIGKVARGLVKEMVDLQSQNGFRLFENGYGPMYKDHRTSHNILEYYLETGDELAKEAFLKLVDQRYRFDRRTVTVSYKNYDAFTHAIAYWMTGDERYRRVVEQTVRDSLYYTGRLPFSKDLAMKPENFLDWPNLLIPFPEVPGPRRSIFMGHHEYHNPFIGLPTALKFLAKEGWSGETTPLIVKPIREPAAKIIFLHKEGEDTLLSLYMKTEYGRRPAVPETVSYETGEKVQGVKCGIEKRMSRGLWFSQHPDAYPEYYEGYHASITFPADKPGGLYLLDPGKGITFTLLDISTKKAALYCPEGFWSQSMGEHSGAMPYGRAGEGRPAFFRVPEGLDELKILLGRPARILAPDGSTAVEISDENEGELVIPAKDRSGTWSIEYHIQSFRGMCPPVFARLLNVEPVVAFGLESHLPGGIKGGIPESKPPVPAPLSPLEFTKGVSQDALRLSGGRTISFPMGEALAAGGHAYFPYASGTVEFWFRADRSTFEIPLGMGQGLNELIFLKAPQVRLTHRYFGRSSYRKIDSTLRIELLSSETGPSPAGFHSAHYFRAGEWTHVAYTWAVSYTHLTLPTN